MEPITVVAIVSNEYRLARYLEDELVKSYGYNGLKLYTDSANISNLIDSGMVIEKTGTDILNGKAYLGAPLGGEVHVGVVIPEWITTLRSGIYGEQLITVYIEGDVDVIESEELENYRDEVVKQVYSTSTYEIMRGMLKISSDVTLETKSLKGVGEEAYRKIEVIRKDRGLAWLLHKK